MLTYASCFAVKKNLKMDEDPIFSFDIFDKFPTDDVSDFELSSIQFENVSEPQSEAITRFPKLSESDIDDIVSKSEAKHTKENTKWALGVFEAWCKERNIFTLCHDMTNEELNRCLKLFYAEARTKDGKPYSRSSLLSLRNSIERYLNNPPFNKGVSISKGDDFKQSNKLLQSQIKLNKRENRENIKHKPAIPQGDMTKLKTSGVLNGDNPWGLLRNVWFNITLYWCRRGREGQKALKRESFQFLLDDEGNEYVCMTHDEATKNHQGGFTDNNSHEKEARMYKTCNDPNFDGLSCLKKYLLKLNPNCESFYQYPKRSLSSENASKNDIWYENRPLGVNRLGSMMKEISQLAHLSREYTNHSVRATAITLWSNAQVPNRHIMAISGHRNEASLQSYNSRPSNNQLKTCSNILSEALGGGQDTPKPLELSIGHHDRETSQNTPTSSLFSGCTIAKVQVYYAK